MRETDTLRIVQAFVVSRRTYALPYQLIRKWQTDQANILLRGTYKTLLGLPVEASSNRLTNMGKQNNF